MTMDEGAAREALFDALEEAHAARARKARAGDYYQRAENDDPDIGVIRASWFEACSQVARAEDAERLAHEALNKILEAKETPVTYTEAQIRAAYHDSGFEPNAVEGLLSALRSLP